jgi:hypothetical protein
MKALRAGTAVVELSDANWEDYRCGKPHRRFRKIGTTEGATAVPQNEKVVGLAQSD